MLYVVMLLCYLCCYVFCLVFFFFCVFTPQFNVLCGL